MPLINYPIALCLITIGDEGDINKIKKELNEHGNVIGEVFTEGNKVKGGAFLWKRNKKGAKDEYILILIGGVAKITEGILSTRGIFDIKEFKENYPMIPVRDIGVFINAAEIYHTAKRITNKSERELIKGVFEEGTPTPDTLKEKEEALKNAKGEEKKRLKEEIEETKEFLEWYKNIPKSENTRDVYLGAITIKGRGKKRREKFNKIFEELNERTGEKEIYASSFGDNQDVDYGIIVWHREVDQTEFNTKGELGKDEYWIIIVMGERATEIRGADVKKFKKTYGKSIPIYSIGTIRGITAFDASTIVKNLGKKIREIREEQLNNIKKKRESQKKAEQL